MAIHYEWDVETVELYGECEEVVDHFHQPSYRAAQVNKRALEKNDPSMRYDIVLVRDEESRGGSRTWAYLREDGTLPQTFEDASGNPATTVPKNFHIEVARCKA